MIANFEKIKELLIKKPACIIVGEVSGKNKDKLLEILTHPQKSK